MPAQVISSVENNFTKGFVTEFTGLNFPENAATDTDNCTYTLVGDVIRRLGIDFEEHFSLASISRAGVAVNTYKWSNAGGDGNTQVVVVQIGGTLHFWKSSAATATSPLSTQILASTVDISSFTATSGVFDATKEAQFADGNGYLFIYHPSCDPVYCTYVSGTIVGNPITVTIRDFLGVVDPIPVNQRPTTLTSAHLYNLSNQGWSQGSPWSATAPNVFNPETTFSIGSRSFNVGTVTGITVGDAVSGAGAYRVNSFQPVMYLLFIGNVTAYAGSTLTINVVATSFSGSFNPSFSGHYVPDGNWSIIPTNHGYIDTWHTAVGGYPSNADVWWYFKNTSNVFDPGTTISNVTLNTGSAPKGHYILEAFNQQRDNASSIVGITDIVTTVRPRTGTWFQGRVWYAGCDASQAASGTANAYSWSENIYFSQIINDVTQLGNCFQTNDPTSEDLFDLLPTDGGVIQIQGCGAIYKLFPIQNGMLVFAANGIWFITGSQGIGFSANDYTITKISAIESISGTSYVNVQGLPYFWNEDGIYTVTPAQQGGLSVQSITYTTVDSYYASLPTSSKKFARGDYDPVNYTIKWIFKDTEAVDVTDRYSFNKILNYNTSNKAFFPYTVDTAHVSINGINYIVNPGGINNTPSMFKYLTTGPVTLTFSDDHDTGYVDWASTTPVDYESYFVTGYKLHGQAIARFQIPYIYVYSRNQEPTQYYIQGIWDYANTGNSGRWSSAQIARVWSPNFGMVFRRHRIRGNGMVLQIKVKSVTGEPFDIMGWSSFETKNQGV